MTLNVSPAELVNHDHFTSASTAPGRPRRYLAGGAGLLPHSCTLFVYKSVSDCLSFTARSLKTGSGVKSIFDQKFTLPKSPVTGRMSLTLSSEHRDYPAFAELLANASEFDAYMSPHNAVDVVDLDVQDSMETDVTLPGQIGIIESWAAVEQLLTAGYDVVVNLSLLRRSGSNKADGYKVTASGPASFAKIYLAMYQYLTKPTMLNLLKMQGTLNAVILKGGHKRGIVTSMMHTANPLIWDYLSAPTAELDGSHKKGVIIDEACMSNVKLSQLICAKVNSESIFLQKCTSVLGDNYANTHSNVCVGIMLPDRGTCLIWRVNLGLVETRQELVDAYVLATRQVVSLHKQWHDDVPANLRDLWRPIDQDRQVAIDPVGLANMLKRFGYTYDQFVKELALVNTGFVNTNSIAYWFAEAYQASTKVAQELAAELGLPSFFRLHTVEPAQRHAFELQDYEEATLCRGIWPPFATVVNRVSDVEGAVTVDHGEVSTLETVAPSTVFELNSQWQLLMNKFGLPHCISADIYEAVDLDWLTKWWNSPQLTAYYQFAGLIDQAYARKQVEQIDLAPRDNFLLDFGRAASKQLDTVNTAGEVCMLNVGAIEGCSVCAE